MPLDKTKIKLLKKIGHELRPTVTVGNKGLTDSVVAEINRALNDHELIKLKLVVEEKDETLQALSNACNLDIIQTIGNIALLYRATANPNPKLSNIVRHS